MPCWILLSCSALISLIAVTPPWWEQWLVFLSLLNSGKMPEQSEWRDKISYKMREWEGVYSLQFPDDNVSTCGPLPCTQRGGLCALGLLGSTKAGSFNTVHWGRYSQDSRSPRSSCPDPSPCAHLRRGHSWWRRAVCPHCETATADQR